MEITLTLTEKEARWLKGMVQNPLCYPDEESPENAKMRSSLFHALPSFDDLYGANAPSDRMAGAPCAAALWETALEDRSTLTHSDLIDRLQSLGITEGQLDGTMEEIERLPYIETSEDMAYTDTRGSAPNASQPEKL